MNAIAYFEIQSTEPAREVAFYEKVFGWQCTLDPSVPIEYYRISTPGINGAILKRPVDTPPTQMGTNAFTCTIQVENFDKTAQLIEEEGGQVAMPKFAIPGIQWQGYFLDADRNVFGIFEWNENAR